LILSFVLIEERKGLIFGIIPTFIGLGYLLVHYLEKPKTDTRADNNEQNG
jgi:hypothetical protein